MDPDGIVLVDKNLREPMNEKLEAELREHEAENLRRAEEKEEIMLNRPGLTDKFLSAAEKVKKLFSKKKDGKEIDIAAMQAAKNAENQH